MVISMCACIVYFVSFLNLLNLESIIYTTEKWHLQIVVAKSFLVEPSLQKEPQPRLVSGGKISPHLRVRPEGSMALLSFTWQLELSN